MDVRGPVHCFQPAVFLLAGFDGSVWRDRKPPRTHPRGISIRLSGRGADNRVSLLVHAYPRYHTGSSHTVSAKRDCRADTGAVVKEADQTPCQYLNAKV